MDEQSLDGRVLVGFRRRHGRRAYLCRGRLGHGWIDPLPLGLQWPHRRQADVGAHQPAWYLRPCRHLRPPRPDGALRRRRRRDAAMPGGMGPERQHLAFDARPRLCRRSQRHLWRARRAARARLGLFIGRCRPRDDRPDEGRRSSASRPRHDFTGDRIPLGGCASALHDDDDDDRDGRHARGDLPCAGREVRDLDQGRVGGRPPLRVVSTSARESSSVTSSAEP